jgi:hypothetical protein
VAGQQGGAATQYVPVSVPPQQGQPYMVPAAQPAAAYQQPQVPVQSVPVQSVPVAQPQQQAYVPVAQPQQQAYAPVAQPQQQAYVPVAIP